jgi:hypothetical protein
MMDIPMEPVVALIAGILIFLIPRLLNYIVASYLVVIGLMGILGTYSRGPVTAAEARLVDPTEWRQRDPSMTPQSAPPRTLGMPSLGRVEFLVWHAARGQSRLHTS